MGRPLQRSLANLGDRGDEAAAILERFKSHLAILPDDDTLGRPSHQPSFFVESLESQIAELRGKPSCERL